MSTQVFNQLLEWRQDKVMTRTCNRPIPRQKISTSIALLIGLGLFSGANYLFYKVYIYNILYQYSTTDALYVANAIFVGYVCIYSPLKRISPINTKIGAITGALPALLGPAAVRQNKQED